MVAHGCLIKLVLFGAMLMLAALNRFVLIPKLERAVVAEQSLGLGVLALVAQLGTLEPAASF